ncbi:putative monooxygenase [Cladophialophora carrionii]|uniref:Putative monooxygenase n=1 Tax=Cladophialophora carrionii TaxID=86049 RepID=A0A1C1CMH6_9EURO|nr:putative monooxygenase [Cladophialophora carrionii]
MSTPPLKVLISGAGIAGPCFAYWLARTRLRTSITIVERSPTPRVTGQAIDIHGPAIEIVKRMKLLEAIRARYTTEEGTVFLNHAGKPVVRFDAGETFTAEYEILRADLSELFLEATKPFDNVRYKYGDSIASLNQIDDDTCVKVKFASGTEETFDVVVAADGSTSRTRPMIMTPQSLGRQHDGEKAHAESEMSKHKEDDTNTDFDKTKASFNFLGMYTAFFSIPRRPDDSRMWQIYSLRKGLCVMIRPHRNPATMGAYLSITMPERGLREPGIDAAMDKGVGETKRMLHDYFDDAGWETTRVLEGMDRADDFYMSGAVQVKLPKWTNGRGVLLGDAAWATFGAGTTLAIGGAYILAGELSKIQSTKDVPRALERYEEVFRPIYAKMDDLIPGFPQVMFPQTAWGIGIRDAVLWFLGKTKVYKLLAMGQGVHWDLPSYDWVDAEKP